MEPVKDIIFGEDLEIRNGDLKVAPSDNQHVEHIFTLDQGQSRQYPLIGVGIYRQQNGTPNKQAFKQRVRRMLNYDNYAIEELKVVTPFDIEVTANRKR